MGNFGVLMLIFSLLLRVPMQSTAARPSALGRALHVAAASGSLHEVKTLLDQWADINAKNADGQTPLHLAVAHGRKEVVRFLLDRGADVRAKDRYGRTTLMKYGVEVALAMMLLTKGADIDARDNEG